MSSTLGLIRMYLSHDFVVYALIVGVSIALCAAMVGVTLVLKRYSFIGDGLSHVAFGAMTIGTILHISSNLYITLPVTVLAAVILLRSRCQAGYPVSCIAGLRLSADECVLDISQCIRRCVYYIIRINIHTDADFTGCRALPHHIRTCHNCIYIPVQQIICSYI